MLRLDMVSQFTILCLIALLLPSCLHKMEDVFFLIPKDFQGLLVVAFDEPEGQAVKYENGIMVYEVPPNGILKTKHKYSRRAHVKSFFLVDSTATRQKLKYFETHKSLSSIQDSSKVFCYFGVLANYVDDNGKQRLFEIYTISNLHNIDSISQLRMIQNLRDY